MGRAASKSSGGVHHIAGADEHHEYLCGHGIPKVDSGTGVERDGRGGWPARRSFSVDVSPPRRKYTAPGSGVEGAKHGDAAGDGYRVAEPVVRAGLGISQLHGGTGGPARGCLGVEVDRALTRGPVQMHADGKGSASHSHRGYRSRCLWAHVGWSNLTDGVVGHPPSLSYRDRPYPQSRARRQEGCCPRRPPIRRSWHFQAGRIGQRGGWLRRPTSAALRVDDPFRHRPPNHPGQGRRPRRCSPTRPPIVGPKQSCSPGDAGACRVASSATVGPADGGAGWDMAPAADGDTIPAPAAHTPAARRISAEFMSAPSKGVHTRGQRCRHHATSASPTAWRSRSGRISERIMKSGWNRPLGAGPGRGRALRVRWGAASQTAAIGRRRSRRAGAHARSARGCARPAAPTLRRG